MAEGLGTLWAGIGLRTGLLEEGAGKVKGILGSMHNSSIPMLGNMATKMEGMGPVAIGAAGAVAGIGIAAVAIGAKSIKEFEEVGKATLKLQRAAGGTAESMSTLRAIAERTGVDTDKLGKGIVVLSGHLSKNDDVAKRLGFSYRDASGHALPMDQILIKLSDKFHNLPPGVDKTALATELFGKRVGMDLLPMLNRGSGELGEFAEKAKKLGLVLTEDNLQAVRDNVKAHREFQEALKGAEVQIGAGLLPIVTKLTQEGIQILTPALHLLVGAFKILSPILEITLLPIKALGAAIEWLSPVIDKVAGVMDGFGKAISNTFSFITGKHKESNDKSKALFDAGSADSTEAAQKAAADGKEREKALSDLSAAAGDSASKQADASNMTIDQIKAETEAAKKNTEDRKAGLDEIATAAGTSAEKQVASSKLTGAEMKQLGDDVKKTHDSMKANFDSSSDVVNKFGTQATVTGKELLQFFKDTQSGAKTWSEDIKALAHSGIDQGLILEVAQAGPKAEPLVKGMLDLVKNGGVGAVNELNSSTRTLRDQTIAVINGMQVDAGTAAHGVGAAASQGFGSGLTVVHQGGWRGWHTWGSGGAWAGHASSAIGSAIDATEAAAPDARDAGESVGSATAQGAIRGLHDGIGGWKNTWRWLIDEGRRAAQAEAQIHSPSELFRREVGRPIGMGVALGISDARIHVERSLIGLMQMAGTVSGPSGFRGGYGQQGALTGTGTPTTTPSQNYQLDVNVQRPDDIVKQVTKELDFAIAARNLV